MSLKKSLTTVGTKKTNGKGLSKFLTPSGNKSLATKTLVSGVSSKTLDVLKESASKFGGDNGHLAYIIDATGSRGDTWENAQSIQKEIFKEVDNAGENLTARVISFGGGKVTDFGWKDKADDIIGAMSEVNCSRGYTQIYDSVQKLLNDSKGHKPKNIIMIGDCCEEDDATVMRAAYLLKAEGIKVFAFHEHTQWGGSDNGEKIYRSFANITGGAFQEFGKDVDLKDLCAAVAAYTTGGDEGLKKLAVRSKAALSIQKQLKLTHKKPSVGLKK